MRKVEKPVDKPDVVESPDYLRGYRDGLKDRQKITRRYSGDGVLGALLAIALMAGVGYLAYNYSRTGRVLPDVDSTQLVPKINTPQR